jgi:hypothetical protein
MKATSLFFIIVSFQLTLWSQNPSCTNIDFESLSTGTVPYTATGWTVCEATNSQTNSVICPASTFTWSQLTNPSNAEIKTTPFADPVCGTIPASPFGGNNIIALNIGNFGLNKITRLAQQFSVTSSNWFYKYAYKGVLYSSNHPCCIDVNVQFNFYDCAGNLIPAACQTISSPSGTCMTAYPPCIQGNPSLWTAHTSTPSMMYTPGWAQYGVNLSQFVGSCVTVEVIAANCAQAAHHCYLFYDAQCASTGSMSISNVGITSGSVSLSCSNIATLSATPCFFNYLWQGPGSSTVTGNTSSTIQTTVAGVYTVTASSGTISSTNTISIGFSTIPASVTINSPTLSGCKWATYNLQASGTSLTSYTWSTGSTLQSIYTTPTITTIYTVSATNSDGCIATDSKTITVHQPPVPVIVSPTAVCIGNSATLTANGPNLVSYLWNTTATTPSIIVTPTLNSFYSLSVVDIYGCKGNATKSISILPNPTVNVTPLTPTACPFQKITLFAFGNGLTTYSWSSGSTLQTTNISSQSSTVYTLQVTDTQSCVGTKTVQVTVMPCADIGENSIPTDRVEIFPNPNEGEFIITGKSECHGMIYNTSGNLISEFFLNKENNYTIRFKDLSKGIYYIRTNENVECLIVR